MGSILALTSSGAVWGMVKPVARPVEVAALPVAPKIPNRVARRAPVSDDDRAEWALFKQRFVSPDGRVIDTGNGGESHSEGQGWGMLLATAFDDVETFDNLHAWTSQHLSRASDALHAWRYLPRSPQPVADQNNATDADLFIASALWRGACQWGRTDLAKSARAIAGDILRQAVCEVGGHTVLLPAVTGFQSRSAITVNPSYYAFPAMEEMESLLPSPLWSKLRRHGMALLESGRFGKWQLPPDWIQIDRETGVLMPHPNWPARFSYDAIRVPLWLAWSQQTPSDSTRPFSEYWAQRLPSPPAWVDLKTNMSANYAAPAGMVAVAQITTELAKGGSAALRPPAFPRIRTAPNYYSAALIMLSRLAWQERHLA